MTKDDFIEYLYLKQTNKTFDGYFDILLPNGSHVSFITVDNLWGVGDQILAEIKGLL